MGEKQFKMLFVLSIYDSSSILTSATDIVCAKRISEKCGKLNTVHAGLSLTDKFVCWRTCIQCVHVGTETQTHARSRLLLELKLNWFLLSPSTPLLPALFAHILETPDSRWISMSKTQKVTQKLQSVHSVKKLCVCVCVGVRVHLCACLQYVQCDWLGIGLFICLVWSWLCNWA